ncbi:hypothetical protein GQ42DRAFT_164625 [Ramicandelaber brevisporus]|nr:hypothetical protein GQ42DRAFT_164625 [Ramicandelaber brevisporus]
MSRAHQLGNETDGLHGVALSQRYPGHVWMTHENGNRLMLVDPKALFIDLPPVVVKTLPIPAPGKGPHYVGEYGDCVWSTLKGSQHVVRINYNNPSDYKIWKVASNPIFIAQHPANKKFYVSCDQSSEIHVIDPAKDTTTVISTTANGGAQTPVGLIAGPNGGVWFAMVGTADNGTGKFGFIDKDDKVTYFQLQSPVAKDASLLHLAFDDHQTDSKKNPGIWLLSSSIVKGNALDAYIRVDFDPTYSKITHEEVAVMPTQRNKAHRLLPLSKRIFATELASSQVAALDYQPGCPLKL